jgi:hypothetical protein
VGLKNAMNVDEARVPMMIVKDLAVDIGVT